MRVLGIDPGTATTGFGIVEKRDGRLIKLDYGTINTPAGMDMPLRLVKINGELNRLLREFQPDAVAVEEIFHHKNAKTVVTVAQARGVVLLAASLAELPVAEYTPLQVKQAVVGYGQAEKRQVQMMVQRLLALDETPRPDDAADALAVAICHLHSYRINSMVKSPSK
ncbi:MAG: crossover junction endodeoxyribonuclease RuvC [Deltaproteobacteria bacterium]